MKAFFITGTDTGVGKTYISVQLLQAFNRLTISTCAMKPIATGAIYQANKQLINDDAIKLKNAASISLPYHEINPFVFEPAVAPNIAADASKQPLTANSVKKSIEKFLTNTADIGIIEGVGGWAVPLNDHQLFADVIIDLALPVILVVAIRLGCLNHALLTYQHMLQHKVNLVGWVANCIGNDSCLLQNINTLQRYINAPCLGIIPKHLIINTVSMEQCNPGMIDFKDTGVSR